ncbi:MAG: hypothetical protein KC544_00890 [Gemmatimonadetes bacterium]|nr:hypothetical protein [Gemmatimonadota bacterium]MCA9761665.1 hypothetical protein [Gemmatimonadota bacterium]
MTRDTSPFRYLLVQALDLARAQLLLFVVVSAGLAGVIWKIFGDDVGRAFDAADMVGALLAGTLLIAILMAAGGVAGTDIKQGYYRALFSKPMAPWWFYLQRWLLGGLVVLTIPVWLGLAFAVAFGKGTGLSAEVFGVVALSYLLIGGAVLLFSTLTSRDWLVAFLLYFLQARLHDAEQIFTALSRDVPAAMALALKVLPPFDLVSPRAPLPSGGDLAHVLLYGAAMVAAALLLLRFRPLGSGGRA